MRLYAGDWAAFLAWCRDHGDQPLPASPTTVAAYLVSQAGRLSSGTLERRVAAIATKHRQQGHTSPSADPAVKAILRDARRNATGRRRPTPSGVQLTLMATRCPGDLAGLRDRALLLLAGVTALGRADLVGIDAEDVRFTGAGVDVVVRGGSRDVGEGRAVAVRRGASPDLCPVRALEDWLRASACRFGPVFRKVDRWGNVEHRRLGSDAIRRILARRQTVLRRGGRAPRSR